ncbi:methyltransferase domain-containing protein [bacterium]|nr:methyltransferase domain-containing protein [bacterium]
MKKKIDSKEIGLEASLLLGSYLFQTEDLHYGYWPADLDVNMNNFTRAQQLHSDFVIAHIPEGVKTILDVGCGAGTLAARLISLGYTVECVSPSRVLTNRCRDRLGTSCRIYECRFRDLKTSSRYDLVLFSESFQYVKLPQALQLAQQLLNQPGHLLICDFFKTDAPGTSALSGGHRLSSFYDHISQFPFSLQQDIDITDQTAPNLDLIDHMLRHAGKPLWELAFFYCEQNYPWLMKILKWKFRKKINRINTRYFSGERNARNFKKFKSYRLLLYALKHPPHG